VSLGSKKPPPSSIWGFHKSITTAQTEGTRRRSDLLGLQAAEEEEEETELDAVLQESSKVLTGLRSEHQAKAERVTAQVEAAQRQEAALQEERRARAAAAAAAEALQKEEADRRRNAEVCS
jgi:hypothetical protein